ncbi:MAG: hypothetical protein R3Y56_01080 [Akkermansia sp.]
MDKKTLLIALPLSAVLCQCTMSVPPSYVPVRPVPDTSTTVVATGAWVDAQYDTYGFPIYGYASGRPVYAYTVSGAPIYSVDAIVSSCYVPTWGPSPNYHGNWRYPRNVHRRQKPHHKR